MNGWLTTVERATSFAVGVHSSGTETFAVVFLGLLVLLVVMKALTTASGTGDIGWVRRLSAVALMIGVLFGSLVAVHAFIDPHLRSVLLRKVAMYGTPLLAMLAVAIPVMGLLLHTRYPVTLLSTAVGLFACIVAMVVTNAVLGSFHGGNGEFAAVKKRTHVLDQFMGNP